MRLYSSSRTIVSMKVGFDISQLAFIGGVAHYTSNLVNELEKQENLTLDYFYASFRKPYKGNIKNVKQVRIPPTVTEPLFNKLRFSVDFFLKDLDIFHSSDWIQPKTKAKKVTTYHDLIPLKYPEWSTKKVVDVHKRRLALVEKEIDMVIAVSESTKRDLLQLSSIPQNKITVIYEGVEDIFVPQPKEAVFAFKRKYNLPEKFILAVGGTGERKNIARIEEARGRYPLVLLRHHGYTQSQVINDLPQEELPLLYAASSVLVYASLYEGFGLPVVEAMSVGTPVITSSVSSLPEVGGEAAMYVNPLDEDDISQKIKDVLENPKKQTEMRQKGFIQAKKFTWTKTAEQTADLYRKVLKK